MATGRIQWKGTDVCMDVVCSGCETHFHVDGEFAYYVECPNCWIVYHVENEVQLKVVNHSMTMHPPLQARRDDDSG